MTCSTVVAWSRSGTLLHVSHFLEPCGGAASWWAAAVDQLVACDNGKFGEVLCALTLLTDCDKTKSLGELPQPESTVQWTMRKDVNEARPAQNVEGWEFAEVTLAIYMNELSLIAVVSPMGQTMNPEADGAVRQLCARLESALVTCSDGDKNPLNGRAEGRDDKAGRVADEAEDLPQLFDELVRELRRVAAEDMHRSNEQSAFSSKEVLAEQQSLTTYFADEKCSPLLKSALRRCTQVMVGQ